jgi:hypothetical protein
MASRNQDSGVRSMMRTQGIVLLLGCAATALLPISKFGLLAVVPVAFILPFFLMKNRASGMEAQLIALQKESEDTGVPLADLIKRETDKIRGS